MDTGMLVALAVAILALVGVVALAVSLSRQRRITAALLEHYREEIESLRAARTPAAPVAVPMTPTVAEFLITDAGKPEPPLDDRIVLSATLGEPLVRAAAFGHGVRRALSPRSLNRIRFEMRREVRRARKQRRREMRDAYRNLRAQEPAA
ncbi:MAG TPA: hypothetical protein VF426_08125 [Marmoricola sp.]